MNEQYEAAIARVSQEVFESGIASHKQPDSDFLAPTDINPAYDNCILIEGYDYIVAGEIQVGQHVKYHESECPMDGCNQWCCHEPVDMEIVWVGTYNDGWQRMMDTSNGSVRIWYYWQ